MPYLALLVIAHPATPHQQHGLCHHLHRLEGDGETETLAAVLAEAGR